MTTRSEQRGLIGAGEDRLCIAAIRALCIDMIEHAGSGHPGAALSMAPALYTLWQDFLKFDPAFPEWINRDRFVLSSGHTCALLYSLIHLTQIAAGDGSSDGAISLDDLRSFRRLDSRCPGHPEFGKTPGIECTTGPLGQGVGTSVGMAIGGRRLRALMNRPSEGLADFRVYALCGDGCLMEGVTAEAASLAGHLGLANLCWIYDNNRITIDGETKLCFSEEVDARFRSMNWSVRRVRDANNLNSLRGAFQGFLKEDARPTLVIIDSTIAFGSPNKAGKPEAHGAPLGLEEAKITKKSYKWPHDDEFFVPDRVYNAFRARFGERGARARKAWAARRAKLERTSPQRFAIIRQVENRDQARVSARLSCPIRAEADGEPFHPRQKSNYLLQSYADVSPLIIGGSADLSAATGTRLATKAISRGDFDGQYIHFGCREHAMAAALNGLSLVGLRPFGSTFLSFSDYCKPAIRLASLMKRPVVYVFSHDSLTAGEDGPTHQPIEQMLALRTIPGLRTFRPADIDELTVAWWVALDETERPTALLLGRTQFPPLERNQPLKPEVLERGAYVLFDYEVSGGIQSRVVLIGSGSDLHLCIAAREVLVRQGICVRVVSAPSPEAFSVQSEQYKLSVLDGPTAAKVVIEQGVSLGWNTYLDCAVRIISMSSFGASGPPNELLERFGFSVDAVCREVQLVLEGNLNAYNNLPLLPR